MAADDREEGGLLAAASAVTGHASWRIEIDTLDWRPKFTMRLWLDASHSPLVVIRTGTDAIPRPGVYPVKIIATGASHASPRDVTIEVTDSTGGKPRRYLVGGMSDSVIIGSVDARGVVRGAMHAAGQRYADAPPGTLLHEYVTRKVDGVFAATRNMTPAPAPVMTADRQERILRRALDGFIITFSGAVNGDGDADSTHTSPLARGFLNSRWSRAATIDSVVAGPDHFYIRLRGRHFPLTCTLAEGVDNDEIRCERDGRRMR